MRRWKTFAFAVLAAFGVFLVVLAVAALVAPHVIDRTGLRERIATELSRQLGAPVTVGSLRLRFLPAPYLQLDKLTLSPSERGAGTIASLAVYPNVLALLRGSVELSTLRLVGADLRVPLPRRTAEEQTGTSADVAAQIKHAATTALAAVAAGAAAQMPKLVVVVDNTTLTLDPGTDRELRFAEMHAHLQLPPGELSIELTCTSNLWERMSLKASVDAISMEGGGQIDVTRLRPQLISRRLLPPDMQLEASEMDVGLHITAHGPDVVQADAVASLPRLQVRYGQKEVAVRGPRLNASVRFDHDTRRATLTQLQIDAPRLQLSGELMLSPGTATLQAQATDVDVSAVRDLALLAASHARVIGTIFDVLRGGTVPQITFRSTGASLDHLADKDALEIRGHLTDGRIHVPGVALDFDQVVGDATVSHGVLAGEHASARLERTIASDGRFRVGLNRGPAELSVDTQVQAQATELAALLKRFVKSPAFQREVDRVTDLAGSVSGELVLGGTTDQVAVTAEASALDVSGRIDGTTVPLRVHGGRFVYDNGGIEGRDLQLVVGSSVLSEGAIRWRPNDPAGFEAIIGASRLVLNEAYPWLIASGWLPPSPWNPQSLSGTLSIASARVHAPTDAPRGWDYELSGSAQALAIESAALQERIPIRYPLSLTAFHVHSAPPTGTAFTADVKASAGVTSTVDLVWRGEQLDVRRLHVRDPASDAVATLQLSPRDLSFSFKGTVVQTALDALIDQPLRFGSLSGDLRAHIRRDRRARVHLEGRMEATDFTVPLKDQQSMTVTHLAADAANGTTQVDATIDPGWGAGVRLRGQIRESEQALMVDATVAADHVEWSRIEPWVSGDGHAGGQSGTAAWQQSVRGTLRIAVQSFTYSGFTWQPVHAALTFAPGAPRLTITDATLCEGLATPGRMTFGPRTLTLAFQPTATDQQLAPLLSCLGIKHESASGQYDLAADVSARGRPAELGRSLAGHVEFTARHGRLYGLPLTTKLFNVLSIATGAVRAMPDLTKEGLRYDTITVKGDVKNGTLVLSEAMLDAPSVKWVAEGEVDLVTGIFNLTLLVAPLRTVDSLVDKIPLLGDVLGGSLVSIPIGISGSFDDPQVTPLPPSAVGKGLLGVMTRTLKLPLTVIQPLLP